MPNLKHRTGSNNVFADLGIPDAPEYLVKADVARKLVEAVRKQGLTQSQAAQLLGIDQPKVSALMRGLLTGFSIDRLLRFVALLGAEVEILIHDSRPQLPAHGLKFAGSECNTFGSASNSSTAYSVLSTEDEDWRLAAPLTVQQYTVNRSLRLDNGELQIR